MALLALIVVSHHRHAESSWEDKAFELAAYVLLSVAAVGRIWSSAYISGNKRTSLIVEGPYSLIRNPLYFFSFLGFIGAGFAFESLILAAAFAVIFILTHGPAIHAEEGRLRREHGAQFDDYCRRVPRFFPRSWTIAHSEHATFSPRLFDRAVRDCALILAVFVAAHVLEWCHIHGVIPVLVRLV
ncbi:MAG TPA: isoprenylcysteine carboxylmethyltransferase family protein [Kiritimatiellia bacterium]